MGVLMPGEEEFPMTPALLRGMELVAHYSRVNHSHGSLVATLEAMRDDLDALDEAQALFAQLRQEEAS